MRYLGGNGGTDLQHIDPENTKDTASKKIWSVAEFAKRHHLDKAEETCLTKLFGQFATAVELQYNVQRKPRSR